MNFTRRAIALPSDYPTLLDIVQLHPQRHTHVIDLPYRLRAVGQLDDPANSAIWLDESGRACAWAVLQTPFWSIDLAVSEAKALPDCTRRSGLGRPRTRPAAGGTPQVTGLVSSMSLKPGRRKSRRWNRPGFNARRTWQWTRGSRCSCGARLDGAEANPAARKVSVRPLGGLAETGACVELHRAAFGFRGDLTRMNGAGAHWHSRGTARTWTWWRRLPDGRRAAFCIGWFHPQGMGSGPAAQVEPLGTHPDFQRRGLGGAARRAVPASGRARGQACVRGMR